MEQGRTHFALWMIGLLILNVSLFLLSLNLGAIQISPSEVFRTFLGEGDSRQELVLFQFRLPGIVIALLVGMALSVSGAILQGVTQNDLAEPGILGINTGAGFVVVLYIFFFQSSMGSLSGWSIYILPLFALVGAFLAALIVYALAWERGIEPIRLILVGIGVNAGFSAALILFQVQMNPQDFMQAMVWLSGDIWSANWNFVGATAPWIFLLIVYSLYKASPLNVLTLGDDLAKGLGAPVEKERIILLLLAVSLAGLSVAAAGGIAFLGLVAPHMARRIVGPRHERMLPVSALLGAAILQAADIMGSNLIAPSEIPVGIVVTIVSTPYFIYLLMKTR
ncbi:iron(3+)-hydroxamate import system permease protein FhuG [Halobacillus andaensis]|uniref:Iron(3+)-hydroxamate import system permease protein FhuG n=2 Tax=Halobacillus andaensis TaxID=1176239 RepID=A0A917BAD2_HALAA|nr:iron ABC transporter permease [Halobacillus andaensis]MBP2006333.1 iron complex transport system permease protein [Halobacillus andaensis]GGF34325.1 iron(3+)-hydroxamate import system permease protein FhuG [Halobacillus andaensis]